jgi:hypothetical protein
MSAVASPAAPAANSGNVVPPAADAGTVPGEVATGTEKPKPKRGRGAAGMSVFAVTDKDTGAAMAKEKGGKFTLFTITDPPAPGAAADAPRRVRYYVSNHRNAVQHKIFTDDGYTIVSGTGENKGGRVADPAKKAEKAEKAFEGLDDAARLALFAKFVKGNPELAAQLPAGAPRDDTTAEFAAATAGNGARTTAPVAAPAAVRMTAPAASAPAAAGKGGTGNKPGKR